MSKILVTGAAALLTAFAVAASSVPASAGGGGGGGVHFSIGLGGFGGPGWYGPGYGYGGGYYAQPYPVSSWSAHVDWCFDHHGPSYNPNTNKYINGYGKVKTCHSPFA